MKLFSIRNKYRFLERLMADERQRLVHYACCRLGNSEDAEDAIQDLFLQFHERMKKTDDNDSLSTNIKNPMAYLYRSLMNLCISKQRSAGRIQMVPLSDKNGENFKTPSFDEEDEMEHEYRRICQLLETIPDEQAEVIRLRFYGEKSFKEIADIIGVNLSTVKSRFMYGLEKIRRGMRASSASDNNHQTIVMYEV